MPATDLAVPALSLSPTGDLNQSWGQISAESRPTLVPSVLRYAAVTSAPLVMADLIALLFALGLAWIATTSLWTSAVVEWKSLAAALLFSFIFVSPAVGLYPGVGLGPVAELRRAGLATACIGPTFLAVSFLQPTKSIAVQIAIVLTSLLLVPSIALLRRVVRQLFGRFSWWGQPCLLAGDTAAADKITRYLKSNPGVGLRPVGFIGERRTADSRDGIRHLAPLGRLRSTLRKLGHPWLIVATDRDLPTVLHHLRGKSHVQILVSRIDGSNGVWRRASACLDWPGHSVRMGVPAQLRPLKRAIDLTLAFAICVPLAPLLVAIGTMIRLTSSGPAIFKQERVGHEGRRFLCWKFRTMASDGQRILEDYLNANPEFREEWERDHKLQYDPRVTTIGRLLRRTSLDELPQLWNVLRGEMSLVGPRPILASEIPDFGADFQAFCSVLPGITGLWQVSGRNHTTYAEHVELDVFYARHWSIWLDVHILMMTFKVVLLRQGAC